MKKLRVGIIGAGRIGKVHALSITNQMPYVQIAYVSDKFEKAANELAETIEGCRVVKDYHDILNDSEIDAVLICSSTDTHASISIEAALAGKHVFCEKPIDHDLNKIKEVLKTVKETGVKYQVGFNRRFDHNFKSVRNAVAEGKIGDVHVVKITSRDPEAPPLDYVKVSGGIFLDMTIHDFDMVRYLTDSEVTEVYAAGNCLVNPEIEKAGDVDTAIITLKFENGALGVIDNSRRAEYGYDQRAEVFGSKGSVAVTNDTPSTAIISTKEGVVSEKPLYFFLERYLKSFTDEMIEFVDAIMKDTDTPVKANDGLQSVIIGLAAKKSVEEGRPVLIQEIIDEYQ